MTRSESPSAPLVLGSHGALYGTTRDGVDSCLRVANASQLDTDRDGCGNACDADYDQTGSVGSSDLAILRRAFGKSLGHPRYNSNLDHDGDDSIGASDFNVFRRQFGGPPGPSGDADRDPVACP